MIAVLDTQLLKAFLAKKPQSRMFRSLKMFNTQRALYGHLLTLSDGLSENVRKLDVSLSAQQSMSDS